MSTYLFFCYAPPADSTFSPSPPPSAELGDRSLRRCDPELTSISAAPGELGSRCASAACLGGVVGGGGGREGSKKRTAAAAFPFSKKETWGGILLTHQSWLIKKKMGDMFTHQPELCFLRH